jgi:hypothetical protein
MNIFAIAPVFCKESVQKEEKNFAKRKKTDFKTRGFVCNVKDLNQKNLEKIEKKALKKLFKNNGKTGQIDWLECPIKNVILIKIGRKLYVLDGKKAIDIPLNPRESYEKIAEKIYDACDVNPAKTVLGMLNKNVQSDTAIPGLIKKIFEKNNLKKGQEENTKKEAANTKKGAKSKEEVKKKGAAPQAKQKFAPKVTFSKVEKSILSIDGKEVTRFTCTKKTVRGAIKKRLVKKNQESVFGFMFKNKKDKWVYYMELFGGKKGDLITEPGWKTKYGKLIKKHDADSSLKEKTTWQTKGNEDDRGSKNNENRTDLSDHFIQNPMETDQNQTSDFFKTAKFNDMTTD